MPAGRSLAVAFALLAAATTAYAVAALTPVFAVRSTEVDGAPRGIADQVRAALDPLEGTSLVRLDRDAVARRLDALPVVRSFTYDRDFPHTLRVTVKTETAAAVARQGSAAWLVSRGGRLLLRVGPHARHDLPRIWIPRTADLQAGGPLGNRSAERAARASGSIAGSRFAGQVATVLVEGGQAVFRVRSGPELRLGPPERLALKLAIAARLLEQQPAVAQAAYLDLAFPKRPVAGPIKPQVGG